MSCVDMSSVLSMCALVLPAGGVKQMAAVAAVGAVGGAVVRKLSRRVWPSGIADLGRLGNT